MARLDRATGHQGPSLEKLGVAVVARAGLLVALLCLVGVESRAQAPKPPPAPPPPPAPRRPLPKLPSGARGFDSAPKAPDAAPRLIAVGGGWGAEEDPKKPTLKSKTAQGYFQLGAKYMERIEFAKAIPPLESAVKLKPDYLEAYRSLGEAYAYDGTDWQEKGKTQDYMLQRYRQAGGAYEQARRLAPKDADIHLNLGVLYFNTGEYQKAAESFEAGVRLWPKGKEFTIPILEFVTLTDVWGFIGEAHENAGRMDKALDAYLQALQGDPEENKRSILSKLGRLYEKLGQPDKALAAYQAVVSANRSVWTTYEEGEEYSRIGALYADKGNNGEAAVAFESAVGVYAKALGANQKYPPEADADTAWRRQWEEEGASLRASLALALYNLGAAQLNLTETEKAAESFGRALELAPDYAAARFNLGFARLALGDKEAAREQVNLLKTTDPELATELEALIDH